MNKKKPTLRWHHHLSWEQLYEYRNQLGMTIVGLIVVVWALSWFLSKSETSSVSHTLKLKRLSSSGSIPLLKR